ncbi:uncharacterized protein M6B38_283280 [Iris pallida]|uniref:Late embryogenesis abundant protein LEA-2 subgroup domain-containing protein n=1 Tax=Iris pallida TaxID=29817 RepID=A0AAX6I0L7_IRIPA|nr:uncharacterized protein M6B38_283280 [Iris pallida]
MESSSEYKQQQHHHQHHHQHQHRSRRRLRICVLVTVAVLISLFLLILILALTVFRPRHAVTTVESVRLAGLNAGFSLPNLSLDLNLTLLLSVAVYNPNRVSFRYADGGSADLRYRDRLVGEAVIPPGGIGSRGSAHLDVTLTVLAGRLIGDSEVYADLAGGSVALVTYTTLPGRVSVLGIIRKHLVSYTTCDVTVDVRNRTVSSSDCRYKTKL